ncbi:MAG: TA system VapC family ribonuclease toxin [Actinomycetota bacterium]|nr:PIN domain-containing protein [Actinomycetota bacterium]
MKLVDANILLYAYDEAATLHAPAKKWLREQLSGAETFAFAWVVLLAFLRLGTSGRIFRSPLHADEALDIIAAWLAQPNAVVVHPTERHTSMLRELLGPLGTAGNLTNDAHLAALSIEHGATLCSADADFGRFAGVKWEDPLRGTAS